jgi:1-acyl-sn-glycerol-3-phosphate acyltransferase
MTAKQRPFHKPPIQRGHFGYQAALPWVWSGITRFHRTTMKTGIEKFPEPKIPTIIVCNHQNGLMDPIIHSAFLPRHQIHWLTRSDIFYARIVRALLFSFNMLPIFRLRDRLPDIGDRNKRVFDVCVERLRLGAVIGLFPEGNHHGERGLRPLKRGVADMVSLAVSKDPGMRDRLKIIPVGLDYEQYDGFKRRLAYRVGDEIPFADLLEPTEEGGQAVGVGPFLRRIESSLKELMIDIPSKMGADLVPYVGALRTTEQEGEDFLKVRDRVRALGNLENSEAIAAAAEKLRASGLLEEVRPEDLGRTAAEARQSSVWTWVMAPLAIVAGLTLWPMMVLLGRMADKQVKDICFKSTFKTTAGMALLPIWWLLLSAVVAIVAGQATDGWSWTWFGGFYGAQVIGTRFAGNWWGRWLDEQGARKAKKAWGAGEEKIRIWSEYVETVEKFAK